MHHACLKILLECGHRVHRDGLYFHVLVLKQAVYVVYLVSRRILAVRFGSTWYSCTPGVLYTVWILQSNRLAPRGEKFPSASPKVTGKYCSSLWH